MKYSIIIPVYKNELSIYRLLEVLDQLSRQLNGLMEAVFVVDGSPDRSFNILQTELNKLSFPAQLVAHSRNFGSFAAIRTGLSIARGEYYAILAADLQEPPELMISFFRSLEQNECDVVIGTRVSRNDPYLSRFLSRLFWSIYRKFVMKDIPEGGVDVFGCNKIFRDQLLRLEEARSSLVALIFWIGFRRKFINYDRLKRLEGKSSWTFSKKLDYMMDSIFAFTDYPIRLLTTLGFLGCIFTVVLAISVFITYLMGQINVPGYVATMLVILFFGMFNIFGLGLVGIYAWRSYENTKMRPLSIIASIEKNNKE